LTACPNCGRELPDGALFCPDCGANAVDSSLAHTDISPSHFNSGMTATAIPQTTDAPVPVPPTDDGFAIPPMPAPEEGKRSSGRRGLVIALIAILAVLLVGTTFETGILGTASVPTVNSASNPLSGAQLYGAYAANQAQASASYTNKTVFIKDSLDFGVTRDYGNGLYYSSVDSGNVILFWSGQTQLGQLSAGATVLAKCSVDGEQFSPGAGNLLVLEGCSLVSVQPVPASTTSLSVPADNE
jgi:hypothetical protein